MQDARFELQGTLAVDLGTGVLSDPSGAPAWLVPIDVLCKFAAADDRAASHLAELVGEQLGTRLGSRITLETDLFVEHLAGECALRGYGNVSLERWGDALIVRVASSRLPASVFAAFFSGVLRAASKREVGCASLGEDEGVARFFVCAPALIPHVSRSLQAGESWQQAIMALSKRGSA